MVRVVPRWAVRLERAASRAWRANLHKIYNPPGVVGLNDGVIVPPFAIMATTPAGIYWQRTGGATHKVTILRRPLRGPVVVPVPVEYL